MKRALILGLVVLLIPSLGHAQTDRDDHKTGTPEYRGTKANAPIPTRFHIRNEGSDVDGAGLCVYATAIIVGAYHEVADLVQGKSSKLWTNAKKQPGGSYPEKLQRDIEKLYPGLKFAQYTGTDPSIMDKLSSEGYAFGATMNTGSLYGWKPIHHAIAVGHYDSKQDLAMVIDNNDPGTYYWMTAKEYNRRWIDGGEGWVYWFPQSLRPAVAASRIWIVHVVSLVILALKRLRSAAGG